MTRDQKIAVYEWAKEPSTIRVITVVLFFEGRITLRRFDFCWGNLRIEGCCLLLLKKDAESKTTWRFLRLVFHNFNEFDQLLANWDVFIFFFFLIGNYHSRDMDFFDFIPLQAIIFERKFFIERKNEFVETLIKSMKIE